MTIDADLYEALAKVRDCLYGASEALDALIGQKSKTILKEYDVSKILWKQKSGEKGPFELADPKDNKDNPEFKALIEHMKEKGGRINKDNLFYWLFQDNETMGRKPQALKKW